MTDFCKEGQESPPCLHNYLRAAIDRLNSVDLCLQTDFLQERKNAIAYTYYIAAPTIDRQYSIDLSLSALLQHPYINVRRDRSIDLSLSLLFAPLCDMSPDNTLQTILFC
jgi:hypothetical protein